MKMNYKGEGGRDVLARLTELGDFAWVVSGGRRELARFCPKGHCLIEVTTGAASHPVWHWDGNKEQPTIIPSIGCDVAPRCGRHDTVSSGHMQGPNA